MKKFRVEITCKDGRNFTMENVKKIETEADIYDQPILITFDDVKPTHFNPVDGMTIKISEMS